MFKNFQETLTFDDVLLVPQKSSVLPKDTELHTDLTRGLKLNLPILSAAMDTITEHKMAIALALAGGIGIIHKNLSIDEQVAEVNMVKRFENGFIEDPLTLFPEDEISKAAAIRERFGYKKLPVVNEQGVLMGILRDTDYFVPDDVNLMAKFRMLPIEDMIVGKQGISLQQANKTIRDQRLGTLCIIDKRGRLVSIVTRRDIEKNELYPNACKNKQKQLRVGAAVSVGKPALERAEALIDAGVDVIMVDTAHGHSAAVLDTVKQIKKKFKTRKVIGGNIATGEAAKALIAAGADGVKVGVGPGSICTTRVVAGVGVPQLSAILNVYKAIKSTRKNIPIIADGGIKNSGDLVKALAAGASSVMVGNMLSGTDETPGRVEFVGGKMFKVYRGMGSIEAMEHGSNARYFQDHITEKKKLVPEGVSGKVLYKGPVERILYQLAGGLRSGMGYCGAKTIRQLQETARFVRITGASLKENHPHGLQKIKSAPNYSAV